MIGTIKTFDLTKLKGLTLTKIELTESFLKLYFGEHRLDIEEYWEYEDQHGKMIDRQLSAKFRKEFKLPQLIGCQIIGLEKVLEVFIFKFDNKESLRVSSPDFEFMDFNHYQAFGDGKVDSPRGFGSSKMIKDINKRLYGNY